MDLSEEEREVLRDFLTPRRLSRWLCSGILACLGLTMILVQMWSVPTQIEFAAITDKIYATNPELLAESQPFRASAMTSLSLALSVANGLVGIFMVVTAVTLLIRTRSQRVLAILAQKLLSDR